MGIRRRWPGCAKGGYDRHRLWTHNAHRQPAGRRRPDRRMVRSYPASGADPTAAPKATSTCLTAPTPCRVVARRSTAVSERVVPRLELSNNALDRWITRSHARLTNPGATPPRDERIAHVLSTAATPSLPPTSAGSPVRGAARVSDRAGVARLRCCRVWRRRSRAPGGHDAWRSRRRTRVVSLAGADHRP
jgi:hypothetical protein